MKRHPPVNSVTAWFHRPYVDGISPSNAVHNFCDTVAEFMKYRRISLTCMNTELYKHAAEATCVMFLASKTQSPWTGPLSNSKRPRGWKATHEAAWRDYVCNVLFTTDVWENIWSRIPVGMWEDHAYNWRHEMEHIVTHYIECQPEAIEEYKEDRETMNLFEEEIVTSTKRRVDGE